MLRLRVAWLVALALLVATPAGGATSAAPGWGAGSATPAAEDAAKAHYKRGSALFLLGHYAAAIKEYEKSFELLPLPAMLFNIAQAHRFAGNVERAIYFYETYLREDPRAPNRAAVRKLVTELKSDLAAGRSTARPPPTAEEMMISDDAPMPGPAGPTPVAGGPAAAGGAKAKAGPPPAVATAKDLRTGIEGSEPPPPGRKRWWIWLAVGAAVVAAAGATTAAVLVTSPRLEVPETTLGWIDAR